MMAIRGLAQVLSKVSGKSLTVLIFHRVLPSPDELCPDEMDARRFDELLGYLRRCWDIVPLDAGLKRMMESARVRNSLAITFDDGYADNAEVALPILRRHGLNATFFVATGFLDGGRMWNDTVIESVRRTRFGGLDLRDLGLGLLPLNDSAARRTAVSTLLPRIKYLEQERRVDLCNEVARRCKVDLPCDLMMTSKQVRELHTAGMEIGAHTVTHPILAKLDQAGAHAEIEDGKKELETLIDDEVRYFAYPNGTPGIDYLPLHAEQARSVGFVGALTTAWGAVGREVDMYQIPRFSPWDRSGPRFALRLCRNLLTNDAAGARER